MLTDIVVSRAHQRLNQIDLHRHAQLSCRPSVFAMIGAFFSRLLKPAS